MVRKLLLTLAVLVHAMLCSSCGRGDHKPLVPVHGRVLFDGKPIPHALVVFHPLEGEGSQGVRPRGHVAADGSFELTSYATRDGAYPGEYRVTVEWWLTRATAKTPEGTNLPPTNRLPARYGKAETSGLLARIEPGTHELPTFHLTR